jgi:hypothetical protein
MPRAGFETAISVFDRFNEEEEEEEKKKKIKVKIEIVLFRCFSHSRWY